jgi:hypothetical protein
MCLCLDSNLLCTLDQAVARARQASFRLLCFFQLTSDYCHCLILPFDVVICSNKLSCVSTKVTEVSSSSSPTSTYASTCLLALLLLPSISLSFALNCRVVDSLLRGCLFLLSISLPGDGFASEERSLTFMLPCCLLPAYWFVMKCTVHYGLLSIVEGTGEITMHHAPKKVIAEILRRHAQKRSLMTSPCFYAER